MAKIVIKTELEIVLPTLPNYVRTVNKDVTLSIADLTEEQIREIGKQWTEAFIHKFRKKKLIKTREINKSLSKLY